MKKLFVLIFIAFFALQGSAQSIALSKANQLYDLYAYSEAVESYEKLLKRSPNNEFLIQRVGYCYLKMGQYKQALNYYERIVQGKRVRYEDEYQYGMLLLTDGQFDKAIAQFKKCMKLNETDVRPQDQINRVENFDKLNLLHLVDTIICEPFNTRFADMSPAFFKDSIAYVSARDSSGRNTYSWNNQPFLDIFQFGFDKKGNPEIQKIPGINTKYHEGPLVFTNNDETVWFTRNNQKFSGAAGEQINNLRIYSSNWNGKKWKGSNEFEYNNDEYSVGHPAFSVDGQTMYFASNMDSTYGATDLFKVTKVEKENKKGKVEVSWSEPVNMGPQFNTVGKEMFPFVDSHGILFFASDGFAGFGGLDIFAAFPVADSFNVINLGQPINSTYDDFGFIVTNNLSDGYFTSNRPGGVGSDDIYSFHIGLQHLMLNVKSLRTKQPIVNTTINYTIDGSTKEYGKTDANGVLWIDVDFQKNYYFEALNPTYISNTDSLQAYEIFKISDHKKTIFLDNKSQLQVLVLNEENNDPLAGVEVILKLENGNEINLITDASGKVIQSLNEPGLIEIEFHKENYVTNQASVDIDEIGAGNFSNTTRLTPIYTGKTITIENLYYDVNSSLIRADAALVLDELLPLLVEFPDMKIELSSHTDCRAKSNYNQWLSQKRAESAVQYLISKGIDKSRMIAVGYGESKLLNHCADGVDCSEEEHQQNRRTEFKILEF
ncbi:MAG: OmpA family protein [Prolixibacteraceae bacterium]|jgi:outer membrane protein OmpA-like peptidoglycan-associated protein/tetratricopeptide (TPR) repeat protein|nr:OmpA family protein [Prolixibacteraceae bacterium]